MTAKRINLTVTTAFTFCFNIWSQQASSLQHNGWNM